MCSSAKHVERAASLTLTGIMFDEAATGQGLPNFLLKALNCGALSEEDTVLTALTMEEIETRSFCRLLAARRQRV